MFVLLRSATRNEAFKIGREIAKTITELNPSPIKLQFEKEYFHKHFILNFRRFITRAC